MVTTNMSIAIHSHRAHAHVQAKQFAGVLPAERAALSRDEQLREARGLVRHFMLAFVAAGAGLYAAVAAGLTV